MNRRTSAPIAIYFLIIIFVSFFWPKISEATDPQKCTQSETCKIGEFFYNDDYTPNTSATCAITSRDPDGALYLNATSLTQASGYYSTTITPTALGTYPSQVCCTSGTEYMCVDKTFEVVAPIPEGSTLTAEDVWGYSNRSLTSFNNLVADIWSYTTRSLTSAITIDTSTLATKKDLEEINNVNAENRIFLEKIVNKPIIQNFIDDKNTPDLTTKIKESQNVLNNLFATTQNLKNRSQILSEEWSNLTSSQIASEINQLKKIVNDPDNKDGSNLVGHTNWLKTTWNSEIFLSLSAKVDETYSRLNSLEADTNKFSPSALHSSFLTYLKLITELDSLTGNTLSEANEPSAFGFLAKTTTNLSELDKNTKALQELLSQAQNPTVELNSQVENITTNVLTQNLLKDYQSIIDPPKVVKAKNLSPQTVFKNKIYSLLSLININKLLLAGNNTGSLKLMWLQEGSIVFRSVAINPSKSLNQSVDVKFFLPDELKKEQIIAFDPELKIDYDATEKALFATANINLAPQESITLTVETEDIWQFNQAEIDIIKNQVAELTNSLKQSTYQTKALSLKSDITVSLDKIMLRQKEAITPENRIRSFRESSLEMIGVSEKVSALKELVDLAGTQGNSFGFVGGIQVVAIWGIVILGIAGFVFLSFYFKTIKNGAQAGNDSEEPIPSLGEHRPFQLRFSRHHHKESGNLKARKLTSLVVLGLISGGVITVASAFGTSLYRYNKTKKLTLENSKQISTPNQVNIKIADSQRVPVKSGPSISSPEVLSLKTDQTLYIYRKLNGWVKVGYTAQESGPSWWISELYLK